MFYAHYLIVKKARLMRSQLLMGTKKNYPQIYSSLKRSSRKLSSFFVKNLWTSYHLRRQEGRRAGGELEELMIFFKY